MKRQTRTFAAALFATFAAIGISGQSPADALFQEGLMLERAEGRLRDAVALYQRVITEFPSERVIVDRARARITALERQAPPINSAATLPRLVVSGNDADRFGDISPDGRHLSFMGTNGDLTLRDLDTGQHRQLTNNGPKSKELAEYSIFSPDGGRLAYSWKNEKGFYELRLIGRNGGDPRPLYVNEQIGWLQPYDWSPDGREILALLAGNDRNRQLVIISVADGSVRTLRTLDWLMGVPGKAAYSADGRFIAYDRAAIVDGARGDSDVHVIAADGSKELSIASGTGKDVFLDWFPDGQSILVSRDNTGTANAWAVPFRNGAPAGEPRLLTPIGPIVPKGFTRTGEFYYFQTAGAADIHLLTIDPSAGRVVEPPAVLSGRPPNGRFAATWSPDGARIVYNIGGPASPLLGIHDVKTGIVKTVPVQMSYARDPIWTPDGAGLVLNGLDVKGRKGSFRIDLSTGAAKDLGVPDEGLEGRLGLAPDGNLLFGRRFLQPDGSGSALFLHNLRTGEERELYRNPGFRDFRLSPDGKLLALRVLEGGGQSLQIMPASGGDRRTILLDKAVTAWSPALAWSADGKYVFAVRNRELWRIPIESGAPQAVGITTGMQSLSVSADGRRLAYVAGAVEDQVWVMENLVSASRGPIAPVR